MEFREFLNLFTLKSWNITAVLLSYLAAYDMELRWNKNLTCLFIVFVLSSPF